MDYRIESKEAFTVLGRVRQFDGNTSYQEIPKFWGEHFQNGGAAHVSGEFGIVYDHKANSSMFNYMIADTFYGGDVPSGYEIKEIPQKMWVIFPSTLDELQNTNTKVWREWLPNCREYVMDGDFNVEMYNCEDGCELWFPVRKV